MSTPEKLIGIFVTLFGRPKVRLAENPVVVVGKDPDGNPAVLALDADGNIQVEPPVGGSLESTQQEVKDAVGLVEIAVAAGNVTLGGLLTDAQLRATAVPVSLSTSGYRGTATVTRAANTTPYTAGDVVGGPLTI